MTQKKSGFICGSVAFFAAAGLLLSAGSSCSDKSVKSDHPQLICPHANQPPDTNGPEFRIISPNGGEVFYVGQQCTVKVTSVYQSNADLQILIGPRMAFGVPGLTSGMSTPSDSIVVFTMPDSLAYAIGGVNVNYSTVSDSCLIEVRTYEGHYPEYSDCYFSIRKP